MAITRNRSKWYVGSSYLAAFNQYMEQDANGKMESDWIDFESAEVVPPDAVEEIDDLLPATVRIYAVTSITTFECSQAPVAVPSKLSHPKLEVPSEIGPMSSMYLVLFVTFIKRYHIWHIGACLKENPLSGVS